MEQDAGLRPAGRDVVLEAVAAGAVFVVDVERAPAQGQRQAVAQAVAEMERAMDREVGADAEAADVEAAAKDPLLAHRCLEPQAHQRVALGSIVFFIGVTSWKTWVMVLKSYDIGAVTNTYPLVPLYIPQLFVAIGFSMLAFTAIHMMIDMIGEALLPRLHRMQGGTESYRTITAGTNLDHVLTEDSTSGV